MTQPDLSAFDPEQKLAFFELLVLTMYADGQLTCAEDDFLKQLLTRAGCADVNGALDQAITKTRPHLQSLAAARQRMLELVGQFTVRQHQRVVYSAVEQMMSADGKISSWESELLAELRLRFRM
jgi:hypothetical protein